MREYIKRMRSERNLSQQKLADAAGVSQQYCNMIETGNRQQDMTYSVMEKLAAAFGVPIQNIIDAEAAYRAERRDSA